MFARSFYTFLTLLLLLTLSACSEKPTQVSVDVNVTFNGAPLGDASVLIDGKESGRTDSQGYFSQKMMLKFNTPISVKVSKDIHGYNANTWEENVVFTEKSGPTFSFRPELTGTPFVTFKVHDGKIAVKNAKIILGKTTLGKTDNTGVFVYNYSEASDKKLDIKVKKHGFESWKKKAVLTPGEVIEADIPQQFILRISTLSEKHNDTINVPAVKVFLGEKLLGKTDKSGNLRVIRRGIKHKKAKLRLVPDGLLPASWETSIKQVGTVKLTHYFYPQTAEKLRIGMFRFVSNTAGEDIGTIPFRFQEALEKRIKKLKGFTIVNNEKLMETFKTAKLSPETAKEKGWKSTELYKMVDVVVFGSVTKNVKGRFIVEANFHSADGGLVFSQIATAKNAGKIDRTAKSIAIKVEESYPIEGLIVKELKDKQYKINIGDNNFEIEDDNRFSALNPKFDKQGKFISYENIGSVVIDDTENNYSIAKVEGIDDGKKPTIGTKLIRQNSVDASKKNYVVVSAKSDIRGNVSALQGVNIYIDDEWMGATGKDGKAKIPVALKKNYDISLYRHGFSQVTDEVKVKTNGELKEFMLDSYYSALMADSEPRGAKVFIDDVEIGRTPMSEAKPVSIGFHTVRLSAGGEWRDWEEIMEFSTDEVDWTGDNLIEFYKDLLTMGEKAITSGSVDQAIDHFKKAKKDHPDYAEIRHTLAQLYLDEKNDPDSAIKEFEKVTAIPEVKELIFKQFAIAYTNQGHAYHEKANNLLHKDKKESAQLLVKAIKSLNKAKENSRFFPNDYYAEAIHDTYYYIAMSYHKLYQLSKKPSLLNKAELAWRDYIDFFPEKLKNNAEFAVSRDSADKFLEQLKK